MKKIFSLLRSMRFGLLLLGLIGLCSVGGSLIPQGESAAHYASLYPKLHPYLLMLGLDHVFTGWFFVLLLVFLCLNLSLCSLLRFRSVTKAASTETARAATLPNEAELTAQGHAKLRELLLSEHCRETELNGVSLFRKNSFGRYGSFLTHLSILLTVIFGALALYLPKESDQSCLPGESLRLENGATLIVHDFHIEDDSGKLDFTSRLSVTQPDGKSSGEKDVSVNHPLLFAGYKIYQQTYGTAGAVTVRNLASGGEDVFALTEPCFLTSDGVNGLWFEALYPGYLRDEDGSFTLISSTSGRYTDPVYQVLLTVDGASTPILAFPGEELTVGELSYLFCDPIEYPGLRIKSTPTLINALLIASFALMLLGLTLCFFFPPVLVKLDKNGYTVAGPKPEGMRLELKELLQSEERRETKC